MTRAIMVVSVVALCAIAGAAFANPTSVSCSGASKFDAFKHYDKGAKVWTHDGGSYYSLWECANPDVAGKCHNGVPGNGSVWKRLGTCDKSPS